MIGLVLAGIGLGLQGLGILGAHKAQNQAADASEKAAAEQKAAVTAAAGNAARVENGQIDRQLEEQQLGFDQTIQSLAAQRSEQKISAKQSILASDRAGRMADATSRLSAGAAGVSGASVDAVLNDIGVQEATSRQSINNNLGAVNRQLDRQETATRDQFYLSVRDTNAQRDAVEANKQNRIAGVQNIATAPHADPFATALQFGGAMLSFGQQVYDQTRPPPPKG